MANRLMPKPVPSFRGKLVTLHAINPEKEAFGYFQMYAEPDIHHWTYNEPYQSVQEAQTELERFVSLDEYSFWTIIDNPTGNVAGRYHIHVSDNENDKSIVRVGVRIAKQFWRKGHHRETQQLIFPYVFNELKADAIESWAWSQNINSIRSMESAGFDFDREESTLNKKYGKILQQRYYILTKGKWSTIKQETTK